MLNLCCISNCNRQKNFEYFFPKVQALVTSDMNILVAQQTDLVFVKNVRSCRNKSKCIVVPHKKKFIGISKIFQLVALDLFSKLIMINVSFFFNARPNCHKDKVFFANYNHSCRRSLHFRYREYYSGWESTHDRVLAIFVCTMNT